MLLSLLLVVVIVVIVVIVVAVVGVVVVIVVEVVSVLRLWISEGLTRAESQIRWVEFLDPQGTPRKFESSNLGRDNLSREIGRISSGL